MLFDPAHAPLVMELYRRKLLHQEFVQEFAKLFPDSFCVGPYTMTTSEMRDDTSRFYPVWDGEGRVVDGSFH